MGTEIGEEANEGTGRRGNRDAQIYYQAHQELTEVIKIDGAAVHLAAWEM
jgi:hypothetical protein